MASQQVKKRIVVAGGNGFLGVFLIQPAGHARNRVAMNFTAPQQSGRRRVHLS